MAEAFSGVPEVLDSARDRVEFRRPEHRPGVELYRAHIVDHAFETHAHEGFGLGAIESGVERFRYRGGEHLAAADSLVLMNADELHTGRAETAQGWRYRMVYVEPDVVEAITGDRGWHFAQAVAHDPLRARRVARLLAQLWCEREPLAFDSLLATLLGELRVHARIGRAPAAEGALRFAPVVDTRFRPVSPFASPRRSPHTNARTHWLSLPTTIMSSRATAISATNWPLSGFNSIDWRQDNIWARTVRRMAHADAVGSASWCSGRVELACPDHCTRTPSR